MTPSTAALCALRSGPQRPRMLTPTEVELLRASKREIAAALRIVCPPTGHQCEHCDGTGGPKP